MATSDSLIQVKNLKKHYHRGAIKALDGVTADINKGDVMVVIGPTSNCIKCVLLFFPNR